MIKDPYVYEGTDVLINKLNIRDPEKLEKAESDFAPSPSTDLGMAVLFSFLAMAIIFIWSAPSLL